MLGWKRVKNYRTRTMDCMEKNIIYNDESLSIKLKILNYGLNGMKIDYYFRELLYC